MSCILTHTCIRHSYYMWTFLELLKHLDPNLWHKYKVFWCPLSYEWILPLASSSHLIFFYLILSGSYCFSFSLCKAARGKWTNENQLWKIKLHSIPSVTGHVLLGVLQRPRNGESQLPQENAACPHWFLIVLGGSNLLHFLFPLPVC